MTWPRLRNVTGNRQSEQQQEPECNYNQILLNRTYLIALFAPSCEFVRHFTVILKNVLYTGAD